MMQFFESEDALVTVMGELTAEPLSSMACACKACFALLDRAVKIISAKNSLPVSQFRLADEPITRTLHFMEVMNANAHKTIAAGSVHTLSIDNHGSLDNHRALVWGRCALGPTHVSPETAALVSDALPRVVGESDFEPVMEQRDVFVQTHTDAMGVMQNIIDTALAAEDLGDEARKEIEVLPNCTNPELQPKLQLRP